MSFSQKPDLRICATAHRIYGPYCGVVDQPSTQVDQRRIIYEACEFRGRHVLPDRNRHFNDSYRIMGTRRCSQTQQDADFVGT